MWHNVVNAVTVIAFLALAVCLVCSVLKVWEDTEQWIVGCSVGLIALIVMGLCYPNSSFPEMLKRGKYEIIDTVKNQSH